MAITKRPKPPTKADINRVIRKGGTVPKQQNDRPALVQLRLPRQLVEQIDVALKSRTVPPSRHTWLLEAIHEKLERAKAADLKSMNSMLRSELTGSFCRKCEAVTDTAIKGKIGTDETLAVCAECGAEK